MALVLGAVCVPVAAAHAHSFRGYAAPVALPSGDSGSLQRLYGDGVALSHPVRLLVTDKRGDVRALGPLGYAAELSCGGSSCRVYVYSGMTLLPEVYRFDPASTKSADIPSVTSADNLDDIMRAEGTYGFVRIHDLSARIAGATACLMQWWPSFIVLLVLGWSAVPVRMCLRMAFGRVEQNRLGSATLAVLCAIAITLSAAGLCLLFLVATAYPPLLSLIAVSIPAVFMAAQFVAGCAGRASLEQRGQQTHFPA